MASPGAAAPALEPAKVRTVACLGGISLERDVPGEEIQDYLDDPRNVVWVDVENPGPAERAMLMELFGFRPLDPDEANSPQHRPRIEPFRGYTLLVAYTIAAEFSPVDLRLVEIDLFLGRNFVVTLHWQPAPALEAAYRHWSRGGASLRDGSGYLLYCILNAITGAYSPVIEAMEAELAETESGMFQRFRPEDAQKLLRMKRSLFNVRRVLRPMRDCFDVLLRRDQPVVAAEALPHLEDVHNHLLRILDVLEIEREMINSAMEASTAVVGHQLNEIVHRLTVVSMLLAVAAAVTGAWGMNTPGVPQWNFWGICAGTLLFMGAALVFGRLRRWW